MATDITQFRADFKAAFSHWRRLGQLSEGEVMQQYQEAAKAVQQNMHDDEWMACAAAHFRQLCIQFAADQARTARIADEIAKSRRAA